MLCVFCEQALFLLFMSEARGFCRKSGLRTPRPPTIFQEERLRWPVRRQAALHRRARPACGGRNVSPHRAPDIWLLSLPPAANLRRRDHKLCFSKLIRNTVAVASVWVLFPVLMAVLNSFFVAFALSFFVAFALNRWSQPIQNAPY